MLTERIFTFIFPLSLLEGTPWYESWQDKERKDFVALARIFFPVTSLVYVGHYFFFDLPMELEPTGKWLLFRLSMAAVAATSAAYYFSSLTELSAYRLPAIVACLIFCYYQSRVTVWYPEAPWLYCFLFVCISALILKTSVVKSCVYAGIAIALQTPSLIEAGLPAPTTVSASVVTIILILASRSGYVAEIRYFLLSQQNLDAQRKNIELNIEFTNRIKSFIPGEIARRLETYLANQKTTVLQAIDEVLRPRKKYVSCLFSDIRGYTEASKDVDSYIGEKVLPNVKECTHAIDDNGGIPRKIGDLIFAYFDGENRKQTVISALSAAFQIAEVNDSQRQDNYSDAISRYILISCGEALVGNIGGFDSSVEITALGSPVNFLARVDELTKHPSVASELRAGDIILSEESFHLLNLADSQIETRTLNLHSLNLQVRNFPDSTLLYVIRPDLENRAQFLTFRQAQTEHDRFNWDKKTGEAAGPRRYKLQRASPDNIPSRRP